MHIISTELISFFLICLFVFILVCWVMRIKKLKEYYSPQLGVVRVWEKYNKERLLTTNGFAQGISIDHKSISKSYWYYQAQQVITFCAPRKNSHVLWLGLGAGTGPRLVAKAAPFSQTIIEIDPVIIQADKEFFGLDELKHVTVIQADAYQEIKKYAKEKRTFDVIVNDIYCDATPRNGERSSEDIFLKDVMKCLKNDGLLLFNRLAQTPDEQIRTEHLLDYLKLHFIHVTKQFIKDPRIYKNEIISATEKRQRT